MADGGGAASTTSDGKDPFATPFHRALEAFRVRAERLGQDRPYQADPELDGHVRATCPVCQAPEQTLTIIEHDRDAYWITVACANGCAEHAVRQALACILADEQPPEEKRTIASFDGSAWTAPLPPPAPLGVADP